MMRRVAFFFAMAGCGGLEAPAPPDLERPLAAPAILTDLNPDPAIVEVSIAAAPGTAELLAGKTAGVWTYRDAADPSALGSVPGPILAAKQGDRIIVHFKNELAVPTTIHWHGLRLPAAADGSTSTQVPIPAGGTFEYRFTAGDVGTFWYHPHIDADQQIERGLYGGFIVSAASEPEVTADRLLILDDVKMTAAGVLAEDTDALDLMLGRQGNVLLVNGKQRPQIIATGRERWRFVNAANGRYFNLELPGVRFLVIGWDGGLVPAPYEVDRLLIAPGERYEVLVELGGISAVLSTVYYDRGHRIPDPGAKALLEIIGGEVKEAAPLPSAWGAMDRLPVSSETPVRSMVLTENDDDAMQPRFFINGEAWPFNTPVMVEQGGIEIWEIDNQAEMDHPFHLHGMFFDVLEVDGTAPERIGWKDTVNVRQKSKLRFAVRYDPLGMWMFHCHILEHAERGMMGELMIHPPP